MKLTNNIGKLYNEGDFVTLHDVLIKKYDFITDDNYSSVIAYISYNINDQMGIENINWIIEKYNKDIQHYNDNIMLIAIHMYGLHHNQNNITYNSKNVSTCATIAYLFNKMNICDVNAILTDGEFVGTYSWKDVYIFLNCIPFMKKTFSDYLELASIIYDNKIFNQVKCTLNRCLNELKDQIVVEQILTKE